MAAWRTRGVPLNVLAITDHTAPPVAGADATLPDPAGRVRQRYGVRTGGAAYLLWMAWNAWHHPGQLTVQAAGAQSLAQVCRRSALNSLLNPKALLFFLVFLPQFVETTSATPVAVQLALLGGVLTVASVVFHGLLGVVGGRLAQALSQRLAQRPALARTQGRVLATVLAALALRLLLTQRPTA